MRSVILRYSWTTYAKGILLVATGGFFALACLLIVLAEAVIKMIIVPLVFVVGMNVLAFGFVKRKLQSTIKMA
jgi:hypothetical protein